MNDPLFKKIQALKKFFLKYDFKTYFVRDTDMNSLKSRIKQEICQLFNFFLDIKHDYLIDNMVGFFQKEYINLKPQEAKEFVNYGPMFPESCLSVGSKYEPNKPSKFINWTSIAPMKTFDEILERPFLESLLLCFYYASSPQLENEVIHLMRRVVNTKEELYNNIFKLELIVNSETRYTYNLISTIIIKLKNLSYYSQNWLHLDDDSSKEQKMDKTIKQLSKLEGFFEKNRHQHNEFRVIQCIFQHIKGPKVILELLMKGFRELDRKKDDFA